MTVPPEPPPEATLDMPVTTERLDGAVMVRVSGDVDYVTTPRLRAAVLEALADGPRVAVIDLLKVGFFGSPGLTLLIQAKRAAEPNVRVRFVASAAVVRPVQLCGLESALEIYSTVDEALTAPVE